MHQRAFDSSWTAFTADGAAWLAAHTDIRLVGVDYLSVAVMEDLTGPHEAILGAVRSKLSAPTVCLRPTYWWQARTAHLLQPTASN